MYDTSGILQDVLLLESRKYLHICPACIQQWRGIGNSNFCPVGATEKVLTAASRETCKVLLFHFCTGAMDSRGDSHLVSTQMHDFKDCSKNISQDETAGVWGQSVDANFAADVDLDILGEINKQNVDEKLRIVEKGNVLG